MHAGMARYGDDDEQEISYKWGLRMRVQQPNFVFVI